MNEKKKKRGKAYIPIPPEPLQATSLALSCACSSRIGSGGCGAGYPLGNKVRFAVRVVLRMKVGDRKFCSMWGRSLSRNGVREAESMERVVMAMVDAKRSCAEMTSERRRRGGSM